MPKRDRPEETNRNWKKSNIVLNTKFGSTAVSFAIKESPTNGFKKGLTGWVNDPTEQEFNLKLEGQITWNLNALFINCGSEHRATFIEADLKNWSQRVAGTLRKAGAKEEFVSWCYWWRTNEGELIVKLSAPAEDFAIQICDKKNSTFTERSKMASKWMNWSSFCKAAKEGKNKNLSYIGTIELKLKGFSVFPERSISSPCMLTLLWDKKSITIDRLLENQTLEFTYDEMDEMNEKSERDEEVVDEDEDEHYEEEQVVTPKTSGKPVWPIGPSFKKH